VACKIIQLIRLTDILNEILQFTNWVKPSTDQLKQEYQREHELKGNDFFDSEEEFLKAINKAKIITITPSEDAKIYNRSDTSSYEELLDLIKSYRSYPKYRNEETLTSLYDKFKENKPMDLPIIIEFSNKSKRIFSGNTRMDIAFQLGINPKVLLVKSNK
jgi:hypothetical protein